MSDTLWIMLTGGAESGAPIAWARLDRSGQVIARGRAAPSSLPAGLPCQAVLAAERMLWLRQAMPGGRPLRGTALVYALEDRLIDEPEAMLAMAGRTGADGTAMVAVVERAWLNATLATLGEHRPGALLPEPMLLSATPDVWRLAWTDRPCLATGQGAVRLDRDETAALAWVGLALEQAQPRPGRLEVLGTNDQPLLDVERWSDALGIEVSRAADYDWATAAWQVSQAGGEIDLLRGDWARTTRRAIEWRPWRPAIRLAVALLALNLIGYLGMQGWQVWQARQLREANRAVFMTAFPDSKVVVDPLLQMRRKVEELRHRAGESTPTDFLPMLARAGTALPAELQEQVGEIRHEAGRLILILPAAGLEGIAWAAAGLRADRRAAAVPGLAEVVLEAQP